MKSVEKIEILSPREQAHLLLEKMLHVQVSTNDTRNDLQQPMNERICAIMTEDFNVTISDVSHEHIIQVNGLEGPFFKTTYFPVSKYDSSRGSSVRIDDFPFQGRNMIPKLPAFKVFEDLTNDEINEELRRVIKDKIESFLRE
jgi:hypothetical protein